LPDGAHRVFARVTCDGYRHRTRMAARAAGRSNVVFEAATDVLFSGIEPGEGVNIVLYEVFAGIPRRLGTAAVVAAVLLEVPTVAGGLGEVWLDLSSPVGRQVGQVHLRVGSGASGPTYVEDAEGSRSCDAAVLSGGWTGFLLINNEINPEHSHAKGRGRTGESSHESEVGNPTSMVAMQLDLLLSPGGDLPAPHQILSGSAMCTNGMWEISSGKRYTSANTIEFVMNHIEREAGVDGVDGPCPRLGQMFCEGTIEPRTNLISGVWHMCYEYSATAVDKGGSWASDACPTAEGQHRKVDGQCGNSPLQGSPQEVADLNHAYGHTMLWCGEHLCAREVSQLMLSIRDPDIVSMRFELERLVATALARRRGSSTGDHLAKRAEGMSSEVLAAADGFGETSKAWVGSCGVSTGRAAESDPIFDPEAFLLAGGLDDAEWRWVLNHAGLWKGHEGEEAYDSAIRRVTTVLLRSEWEKETVDLLAREPSTPTSKGRPRQHACGSGGRTAWRIRLPHVHVSGSFVMWQRGLAPHLIYPLLSQSLPLAKCALTKVPSPPMNDTPAEPIAPKLLLLDVGEIANLTVTGASHEEFYLVLHVGSHRLFTAPTCVNVSAGTASFGALRFLVPVPRDFLREPEGLPIRARLFKVSGAADIGGAVAENRAPWRSSEMAPLLRVCAMAAIREEVKTREEASCKTHGSRLESLFSREKIGSSLSEISTRLGLRSSAMDGLYDWKDDWARHIPPPTRPDELVGQGELPIPVEAIGQEVELRIPLSVSMGELLTRGSVGEKLIRAVSAREEAAIAERFALIGASAAAGVAGQILRASVGESHLGGVGAFAKAELAEEVIAEALGSLTSRTVYAGKLTIRVVCIDPHVAPKPVPIVDSIACENDGRPHVLPSETPQRSTPSPSPSAARWCTTESAVACTAALDESSRTLDDGITKTSGGAEGFAAQMAYVAAAGEDRNAHVDRSILSAALAIRINPYHGLQRHELKADRPSGLVFYSWSDLEKRDIALHTRKLESYLADEDAALKALARRGAAVAGLVDSRRKELAAAMVRDTELKAIDDVAGFISRFSWASSALRPFSPVAAMTTTVNGPDDRLLLLDVVASALRGVRIPRVLPPAQESIVALLINSVRATRELLHIWEGGFDRARRMAAPTAERDRLLASLADNSFRTTISSATSQHEVWYGYRMLPAQEGHQTIRQRALAALDRSSYARCLVAYYAHLRRLCSAISVLSRARQALVRMLPPDYRWARAVGHLTVGYFLAKWRLCPINWADRGGGQSDMLTWSRRLRGGRRMPALQAELLEMDGIPPKARAQILREARALGVARPARLGPPPSRDPWLGGPSAGVDPGETPNEFYRVSDTGYRRVETCLAEVDEAAAVAREGIEMEEGPPPPPEPALTYTYLVRVVTSNKSTYNLSTVVGAGAFLVFCVRGSCGPTGEMSEQWNIEASQPLPLDLSTLVATYPSHSEGSWATSGLRFALWPSGRRLGGETRREEATELFRAGQTDVFALQLGERLGDLVGAQIRLEDDWARTGVGTSTGAWIVDKVEVALAAGNQHLDMFAVAAAARGGTLDTAVQGCEWCFAANLGGSEAWKDSSRDGRWGAIRVGREWCELDLVPVVHVLLNVSDVGASPTDLILTFINHTGDRSATVSLSKHASSLTTSGHHFILSCDDAGAPLWSTEDPVAIEVELLAGNANFTGTHYAILLHSISVWCEFSCTRVDFQFHDWLWLECDADAHPASGVAAFLRPNEMPHKRTLSAKGGRLLAPPQAPLHAPQFQIINFDSNRQPSSASTSGDAKPNRSGSFEEPSLHINVGVTDSAAESVQWLIQCVRSPRSASALASNAVIVEFTSASPIFALSLSQLVSALDSRAPQPSLDDGAVIRETHHSINSPHCSNPGAQATIAALCAGCYFWRAAAFNPSYGRGAFSPVAMVELTVASNGTSLRVNKRIELPPLLRESRSSEREHVVCAFALGASDAHISRVPFEIALRKLPCEDNSSKDTCESASGDGHQCDRVHRGDRVHASVSATPLVLVGDAEISHGRIDLTPLHKGMGLAGAAWWDVPLRISNGFEVNFTVHATPAQGCQRASDGFAFVLQLDPRGTNALGCPSTGLGYSGLQNALAVQVCTAPSCASTRRVLATVASAGTSVSHSREDWLGQAFEEESDDVGEAAYLCTLPYPHEHAFLVPASLSEKECICPFTGALFIAPTLPAGPDPRREEANLSHRYDHVSIQCSATQSPRRRGADAEASDASLAHGIATGPDGSLAAAQLIWPVDDGIPHYVRILMEPDRFTSRDGKCGKSTSLRGKMGGWDAPDTPMHRLLVFIDNMAKPLLCCNLSIIELFGGSSRWNSVGDGMLAGITAAGGSSRGSFAISDWSVHQLHRTDTWLSRAARTLGVRAT